MAQIKRVRLNNTSRKGYYWRIYDSKGKSHYYKYHARENKSVPVDKLMDFEIKKDQQKASKELKEEKPDQYPDGVTIHFRIDYGVGHHNTKTELKDTFVEILDTKGKSDDEIISEAKNRLAEFWANTVGYDQARNITDGIEEEKMIIGLEKGAIGERIQIRTRYGSYSTTQTKLLRSSEKFREEKNQEKIFLEKHRGKK